MSHKDTIEEIVKEFEEFVRNSKTLDFSVQDADYVSIRDFLRQALQKSFHAGLQRAGEIAGEQQVWSLGIYNFIKKSDLLSALTKEAENK